jgi:hypothetical protein
MSIVFLVSFGDRRTSSVERVIIKYKILTKIGKFK